MQKNRNFLQDGTIFISWFLWMGRKIENIPVKTKVRWALLFQNGHTSVLGYALGATDLHGENIIAHGEYPVIIDMETYPGYLKQQSEKDGSSVEEK